MKYISERKILSVISNCYRQQRGKEGAWELALRMIDAINELPSEAEKTAQWVGEYDGYADGYPVVDMWSCSACGKRFDEWEEQPTWKFCPCCGAKMEVEDETNGCENG